MAPPDETQEQELPPFIIEHARSGRSKCKGCKRLIDKGDVRLGVLVEGPYGPGHMWNHLECAAKRLLPKVEEAYECAAWENAKTPPDPDELPTLETLRALGAEAEVEREKKDKERKTIPYAEVAPSGRSKCKQSGEPIPQGAVRIVLGKEAAFGNQVRTSAFTVLPQFVGDALEDEEVNTDADTLLDELRANSKIEAGLLEEAIDVIGQLD